MERDLILSASLAAALHGAALFGFNSSAAPRDPAPPPEPPRYFPLLPLPEPDPVPPEESASVAQAASAPRPEFSPPLQPEPPSVSRPGDFPIPVPPVIPTAFSDTTSLPTLRPTAAGVADGTGPGGDILGIDGLDAAPRTRLQPAPIYPADARHSGLAGEVVVEFTIDESGRVHDARVVRSNHRMFEEPTLRAVSRWVFEPGKRAGRAVRFRMAVPVIFSLND
ncbi:MAG: hypothetical protein B9S34_02875 [Opitutia bacterium Tous-C1TDCM]|nr:MAG: hypothetical protein B9S34_02875 [Opitutae bacterium Tous-C1TDCM]